MDAETSSEISRLDLEIFRLNARVQLLEAFALKAYFALQAQTRGDVAEAQRAILHELEEYAAQGESLFLSDRAMSRLTVEQRAQYADEYRELVDQMKALILELPNMENLGDAS